MPDESGAGERSFLFTFRALPRLLDPESVFISDRELVLRTLDGEAACFQVLVRRHGAPLWGTLRSRLRNVEDAREVLQETWLHAYERLESLREPRRLRAWLLAIALNLARTRLQRARVEADALSIRDEPEVAPEAPASEALERDELGRRLRAEVASLPPRQREVVDLRIHHGLDHREIAALLGIQEANSRANFYQAMRRLRERLRASEDEE